jgi:hypothetical protein
MAAGDALFRATAGTLGLATLLTGGWLAASMWKGYTDVTEWEVRAVCLARASIPPKPGHTPGPRFFSRTSTPHPTTKNSANARPPPRPPTRRRRPSRSET